MSKFYSSLLNCQASRNSITSTITEIQLQNYLLASHHCFGLWTYIYLMIWNFGQKSVAWKWRHWYFVLSSQLNFQDGHCAIATDFRSSLWPFFFIFRSIWLTPRDKGKVIFHVEPWKSLHLNLKCHISMFKDYGTAGKAVQLFKCQLYFNGGK